MFTYVTKRLYFIDDLQHLFRPEIDRWFRSDQRTASFQACAANSNMSKQKRSIQL